MTKDEFILKLKDTFEEMLLNQVDVINSDEKEDGDEEMMIALYQVFNTVLSNQELLNALYNTEMTYEEVKAVAEQEYKRQN